MTFESYPPLDPSVLIKTVSPPAKLVVMMALTQTPKDEFVSALTLAQQLNTMQEKPLGRNFMRGNNRRASTLPLYYCRSLVPAGLVELDREKKGIDMVRLTATGEYAGHVAAGTMLPHELEGMPVLLTDVVGRSESHITSHGLPSKLAFYDAIHASRDHSATIVKLRRAAEISSSATEASIDKLEQLKILTIKRRRIPAERIFELGYPSEEMRLREDRGPLASIVAEELLYLRGLGVERLSGGQMHTIIERVARRSDMSHKLAWRALIDLIRRQATFEVPLVRETTLGSRSPDATKVTITKPYVDYTRRLVKSWKQLIGTESRNDTYRRRAVERAQEIIDNKTAVAALFARFYGNTIPPPMPWNEDDEPNP